jgi:serine/threonine-protein kinase
MGSVLAPGDIVAEKYRIDGTLGSGGNGAVFRAMHLVLDRSVAIKVLHPQIATETGSARFLREARTLGRLKSDHVAEIFDVGELPDGALYLVMELLEGIDLADLVAKRGAIPVPEAVRHVLDVCTALAEAHAAGIVHRDLKPSNLFLVPTPNGGTRIKVIDFGIAKVLPEHTLTEAGAIMGTPAYMAPEQLGLGGAIDARTDIWALGVILFELVTGERPFAVQSLVSAIAQIMATPATGPVLQR